MASTRYCERIDINVVNVVSLQIESHNGNTYEFNCKNPQSPCCMTNIVQVEDFESIFILSNFISDNQK
jgi:hypothetical protein